MIVQISVNQLRLSDLNELDDASFVGVLSEIFEHSPWVAERVCNLKPFVSIQSLHQKMVQQVANASTREQLDLIVAHPDLAGKAALSGELTDSSTSEQAGAGLDTLTQQEFDQFNTLNGAYKTQFGFPFILAVKGHDKHSILKQFERRLEHSPEDEREEALRQIAEIGRFRLEALLIQEIE